MDVDHEPPAYTSGMNVNKPDLYHGERSKLDDWLMQWDLFFTFQGEKVPEIKRVVLVASYMRGKAFQWIKPFVQQYQAGEAPDEVDEWMRDFDAFKEKIKPIFGVSNEPTIARRNIQRIRQEKSAADYAAEFQQLAANTDWDDTALMTMFRQGLKPKVKEELMRTGASVETLDSLINTAIDIDVRLQELQQELRDDPRARVVLTDRRPPPRNPWRNNNFHRGQRGGYYQSNTGRRIHQNTNSGYHGLEAMDLSNINKGPDRWNKDRSKGSKPNKSSVTCYGCGKQGHFARDCRMKNKVVRQLNVLTTSDEGTGDEWEVLTDDMGRLMTDDYSGSDDDYIEYSDEDMSQIDVREAYDRAPTPYLEEEPQVLRKPTRTRTAREQHEENWCDRAVREANERQARDTARHNQVYGCCNSVNALTAIPTENPQETKAWLEKILKGYCDQGTQTDSTSLKPGFKKDCENALVAINNILKSEDEWGHEWIQEWAKNNQATLEQIQKSNGDQKGLGEPDFDRRPIALRHTRPMYDLDYRNKKHGLLSWTACSYDECNIHYDSKVAEGWFPSSRRPCQQRWYECNNDLCEVHLWDKRTKQHFPGEANPQVAFSKFLVINDRCFNPNWQRCLNDKCPAHAERKEQNGYGPDKLFLGQRLRAPGIAPLTTLGSIASSNSRSL
jgi:hypothetical protein